MRQATEIVHLLIICTYLHAHCCNKQSYLKEFSRSYRLPPPSPPSPLFFSSLFSSASMAFRRDKFPLARFLPVLVAAPLIAVLPGVVCTWFCGVFLCGVFLCGVFVFAAGVVGNVLPVFWRGRVFTPGFVDVLVLEVVEDDDFRKEKPELSVCPPPPGAVVAAAVAGITVVSFAFWHCSCFYKT